jgi:hypothetical protein
MAAENVPAWQERQVSAAMAPLAAENLPAPQLVHVSTLVSAEYVPTGQSVQTEAPAAEYLPAGQSMHSEAADAEYLPAPQLVHVSTLV